MRRMTPIECLHRIEREPVYAGSYFLSADGDMVKFSEVERAMRKLDESLKDDPFLRHLFHADSYGIIYQLDLDGEPRKRLYEAQPNYELDREYSEFCDAVADGSYPYDY